MANQCKWILTILDNNFDGKANKKESSFYNN